MNGPSFRHAVAEVQPAVRRLTDLEFRVFLVACHAEHARRAGATIAATWAEDQATRLRRMDGAIA